MELKKSKKDAFYLQYQEIKKAAIIYYLLKEC